MLPTNNPQIENQIVKLASAWGVIGITSWTELGAFLGAIYTTLLISEWCWKKIWRPLLVQRGYLAPLPPRKVYDDE